MEKSVKYILFLMVLSLPCQGVEYYVVGDVNVGGKLITKQGPEYNVLAYGAVGDGVTADSAAIQAAIDAATLGETILLPAGTYKANSLTITKEGLHFKGKGREVTKIINSSNNATITVTGADYFTIEEMTIDGNDANCVSVHLDQSNFYTISKMLFEDANTGLQITGGYVGNISDCDFRRNDYGLVLDPITDSNQCNAVTIEKVTFSDNNYGLLVNGELGVSVVNCTIDSNRYYGIYVGNVSTADVTGLKITDNYFENNPNNVYLGDSSVMTNTVQDVRILHNYWLIGAGTDPNQERQVGVYIDKATDTVIRDNIFRYGGDDPNDANDDPNFIYITSNGTDTYIEQQADSQYRVGFVDNGANTIIIDPLDSYGHYALKGSNPILALKGSDDPASGTRTNAIRFYNSVEDMMAEIRQVYVNATPIFTFDTNDSTAEFSFILDANEVFAIDNDGNSTMEDLTVTEGVQAEHLYTTDDIQVDDDAIVNGQLTVPLIETAAVGDVLDIQPDSTGADGAERVKFFKNANATDEQPSIAIYGYKETATAAQKVGKIYIDRYGRLTFGGTAISTYCDNDLVVNGYLRNPGTQRMMFGWNTDQTNNSAFLGIQYYAAGNDTSALIIGQESDAAYDFGHALDADPALYIHSSNQSQTEYIGFTHDQTDGLITIGAGDLQLLPATGLVGIGGAPTTALDVTGDIKTSADFYQGANQGLSATYTFGGGGSGDIASMTFNGGILTGVTTVP